MRNGEIAVEIATEPLLWKDKKRIFGLAISFTRYELTESRLLVKTGLLNIHEEELRLFGICLHRNPCWIGYLAWGPLYCTHRMLLPLR